MDWLFRHLPGPRRGLPPGNSVEARHHEARLQVHHRTWNDWRRTHPEIRPDLRKARFNPYITGTTLYSEKSIFRPFEDWHLEKLDLRDADCREAEIRAVLLTRADLRRADLRGAEIRWTNLVGADLRGADLRSAQFLRTDLTDAQLDGAVFGGTHIGYSNLTAARGLERIDHRAGSYIDQLTLIESMPLPPAFLTGTAVDGDTIAMAERYLALPAERRPRTCFISYSRRDEAVAERIRSLLTKAGVPSWFAPTDLRDAAEQDGSKELQRDLHTYIDTAECVILLISPNVLPSRWIGREVSRAVSKTAKIVPVLIDAMPAPKASEWMRLLVDADETERYYDMNPGLFSDLLANALATGQHLDLRGSLTTAQLAARLPDLLAWIGR